MATIKSYTTIEQSCKLAKFLPLESADMFLAMDGIVPVMSKYIDDGLVTADETAIPCWSLAALLDVLPNMISRYFKILGWCYSEWDCAYMDEDGEIKYNSIADNPVDACYEMIIKLHELNLL